jgi:hypothetical protein
VIVEGGFTDPDTETTLVSGAGKRQALSQSGSGPR